jgi:hypothetical protein
MKSASMLLFLICGYFSVIQSVQAEQVYFTATAAQSGFTGNIAGVEGIPPATTSIGTPLTSVAFDFSNQPFDRIAAVGAPMATSNSPTYGHPNSPRQDG